MVGETAAGSENNMEAQALLEAANSASERLAGLHISFMALCAYVLLVVFGTTHFDLLIGKGVKLPVVDVVVPIIGFYIFGPFSVVLAHFNLLLQLQLLSRKLFAFDARAPKNEGVGGLRDRLSIFPYAYYLVGAPSSLVRPLLGLMVSITLVFLPVFTLLAFQFQFLAYQSEVIAWIQRVAIWLDIAVIVILWPLIFRFDDNWYAYWRELIAAYVPRWRALPSFVLLLAGVFSILFAATNKAVFAGIVLLLVSALSMIPLLGWRVTSTALKLFLASLVAASILSTVEGIHLFKPDFWDWKPFPFLFSPALLIPLAVLWRPGTPRGSLALIFTLVIGLPLPLAFQVDGEQLEQLVTRAQGSARPSTVLSEGLLAGSRALDVAYQVLLAKPPTPEARALINSGQWREGLKQVEPVKLENRSLRHARMWGVKLVGANLAGADLWQADFAGAELQGANLRVAHLQSANLERTHLQGADLTLATLPAADLRGAALVGADLEFTNLTGADLSNADLNGANLSGSNLANANLSNTVWTDGKRCKKGSIGECDD